MSEIFIKTNDGRFIGSDGLSHTMKQPRGGFLRKRVNEKKEIDTNDSSIVDEEEVDVKTKSSVLNEEKNPNRLQLV